MSPRSHVGQRRVHGAHHAGEVHVDDPRQRSDWRARHRADRCDPGVGDDDVDGAELASRGVNGPLDGGLVGHVALEPRVAMPELRGQRGEAIRLQPDQCEPRTARRELPRRLRPDASRRPGDKDDAAVQ
ncbi:MAG TPA: hypothetical protein VNG89_17260 [Vicinamibacterales bacterium]|nr:hypothetical protein [Vicinamibacterales bacterium]